jgi:transposase
VAPARAADAGCHLVADQLAAAAGEARWTVDQALALLLAVARGESPDAAALWEHAAKDRGVTVAGGIDEVSIRKGHTYRIVVSDLERRRPIWFGGQDRSEANLDLFYPWLGAGKNQRVRLAVMDRWKAFRNSTVRHAPHASSLFDQFHVMRHRGAKVGRRRVTF